MDGCSVSIPWFEYLPAHCCLSKLIIWLYVHLRYKCHMDAQGRHLFSSLLCMPLIMWTWMFTNYKSTGIPEIVVNLRLVVLRGLLYHALTWGNMSAVNKNYDCCRVQNVQWHCQVVAPLPSNSPGSSIVPPTRARPLTDKCLFTCSISSFPSFWTF